MSNAVEGVVPESRCTETLDRDLEPDHGKQSGLDREHACKTKSDEDSAPGREGSPKVNNAGGIEAQPDGRGSQIGDREAVETCNEQLCSAPVR